MKNSFYLKILCFLLSFFIVAFSQPAWIGFLGFFAACLGYLLFWASINNLTNKYKFFYSFLWFALVQAIQLSWFTSTKYQGYIILLVYFFLIFWFSLEFAFVSYLALKDKKITFLKILFVCSLWTVFEWSRLFVLCGFSFNLAGVAYTNCHFSLQLAAFFGIYGLSFYVFFVNLTGLKAFLEKSRTSCIFWILLASLPYFYGYFHEKIYEKKIAKSDKLSLCIVQTALLPEQKVLTKDYFEDFISPFVQWQRIINFINKANIQKVDLIVLPEAALPYSAHDHFYPFPEVKKLFLNTFGYDKFLKLPDLKKPYAIEYDNIFYVSNSYFAKALANIYNAEIVIGLDDFDEKLKQSYNAAFYFQPKSHLFERYEKQVLVPVGEYIPFFWLKDYIFKKYGISSSFTHGKENKVFSDRKYSFSICYEETFSHIMRKARLKGAKCFINLTNDAYFYKSKLFKQHFDHAKIRAIENGIPLIRACNTGVSAAIDSLGRVVDAIYSEDEARAIGIKIPLFSYRTVYSLLGNNLIISFSFICMFVFFLDRKFKKHKS